MCQRSPDEIVRAKFLTRVEIMLCRAMLALPPPLLPYSFIPNMSVSIETMHPGTLSYNPQGKPAGWSGTV